MKINDIEEKQNHVNRALIKVDDQANSHQQHGFDISSSFQSPVQLQFQSPTDDIQTFAINQLILYFKQVIFGRFLQNISLFLNHIIPAFYDLHHQY